ncbi:MAG: hypothetical protein NPIRA05_13260 [Nitrospirales bacterium]|nr:MAG: hypothetical protein NPIRA05_13260 [Nitrospirales bacterium]
MECEKTILEICFVRPSSSPTTSIFGFSEFISALALLVIVYTVTDIRYRFRVAVAPLHLFWLTYVLIGVIGFLILLTDVWVTEHWLVPLSLISQAEWRGILGGFFLLLAMQWLYYAFIKPPIFGKGNYKKFANELYKLILKGSENELPVIANELARSAASLVKLSRETPSSWKDDVDNEKEKRRKADASAYAHDLILLIANRKLCRHIVASSPLTAMAFFEEMAFNQKYSIPIGSFAVNISTEAILHNDSILYHEGEGYISGLMGYRKDFSQALYGNFRLVEALAHDGRSPLDIPYEFVRSWNVAQLEVYSRVVLITLQNYLDSNRWNQHSFALYRALKNIECSCRDVYKLNNVAQDCFSSDIFLRLKAAVDFVKEAGNLLGQQDTLPPTVLRVRDRQKHRGDLYDHIANLMFEKILSAASVKEPEDTCWWIHHNVVWFEFFGFIREGKAWKIINHKLRRLLYDEIRRLDDLPNYKSSKILGFCLNVLGPIVRNERYDREQNPLHKAIIAWTRKNYLRLRSIQPDVAQSCLLGSISFDEQSARLVKTYSKGLSLEVPKEYLELAT